EASFNLYNANDQAHNQFVIDVNRWVPGTTRRVMDANVSHLIIGGNSSEPQSIGADGNYPQSLFHDLYFSLTDKSEENIKKFTSICEKYLSGHPGIQQFVTGGLTDIKRDVSVRNFEVAVSIVYESKKAYDDYLKSKKHEEFFPATAGMISNTYIFDSYIKYQSKVYSLTR
ncbi:MAG: Dabb family protein, partial [Flavobacterium sp.]